MGDSRADVNRTGAGHERWVDSASLPKSKLCHTSEAFAEDYIALEDALTHSHGPQGKHAHGPTAFTTWLDPTLAVKQADAVRGSLAEHSAKLMIWEGEPQEQTATKLAEPGLDSVTVAWRGGRAENRSTVWRASLRPAGG